jgi:hypothetical protein
VDVLDQVDAEAVQTVPAVWYLDPAVPAVDPAVPAVDPAVPAVDPAVPAVDPVLAAPMDLAMVLATVLSLKEDEETCAAAICA